MKKYMGPYLVRLINFESSVDMSSHASVEWNCFWRCEMLFHFILYYRQNYLFMLGLMLNNNSKMNPRNYHMLYIYVPSHSPSPELGVQMGLLPT